jgi:hypothetical protein
MLYEPICRLSVYAKILLDNLPEWYTRHSHPMLYDILSHNINRVVAECEEV